MTSCEARGYKKGWSRCIAIIFLHVHVCCRCLSKSLIIPWTLLDGM